MKEEEFNIEKTDEKLFEIAGERLAREIAQTGVTAKVAIQALQQMSGRNLCEKVRDVDIIRGINEMDNICRAATKYPIRVIRI